MPRVEPTTRQQRLRLTMIAGLQNRLSFMIASMAIVVLVVIFGEIPGGSLFSQVVQNSAHAPAFALIGWQLVRASYVFSAKRKLGPAIRFLIAVVVSVLLGTLTEAIQYILNRDASAEDVLHDLIGACIGAGFAIRQKTELPYARFTRYLLDSAIVLLLIVAAAPLLDCLAAYANRNYRAPTILELRTPLDSYFLQGCVDDAAAISWRDAFSASRSKPVESTLRSDCGRKLVVVEPYPDWQAHQYLYVDLETLAPTDAELVIRVDDSRHNYQFTDRFNRVFRIGAGQRRIVRFSINEIRAAPASRAMDMQHIANIIIFTTAEFEGTRLRVWRCWLD